MQAEQRENRTSAMKERVALGFFWKLLENGGDQLITFAISIVLARLLGPEKYGTMALMLIFVALGNVIIQTGFQTALIQKRRVDERDFSSVFWLGLFAALLLYGLIYGTAPMIGSFFGDPAIGPMLRVLSLMLFFGAVISVETAWISRRMDFRKQCVATVVADILSGVAGIAAAFSGAGTWALVLQQVFKNLFLMVILLCTAGWRPRFLFSIRRLASLFSFGWKVLLSGLLDTAYNNLYTPVISKLYNPALTGFYSRGNQFPQIIANSLAQTMQAVMLPAFSRAQDEEERLRTMLRRTIKLGCFFMFPMMFGLAAVAAPLIRLLLGESWAGCVPYLAICAAGYSVWPLHIANLQAISAQGRSDLYLKLEILKKTLGICLLVFSARYGILTMVALKSAMDFLCTVINAWPNRKLLGYGPLRQWKDVLPEFFAALVMGLLVASLQRLLPLGAAGKLILQIGAGVLIYGGIAAVFRLESFSYCLETLRQLMEKRRNRS